MSASGKTKTYVRPAFRLVPGIGHLTPLDQYMVRIMLPFMFIFETDPSVDRDDVIDNLQTGLAYTIDELSFLAADIVPESEDKDTIQLEYGDDPGVWFHLSEEMGVSFQELSERNFPFTLLPSERFTPEPRKHHPDRCPALAAQVTFIDGGLVLGFCVHHSVVDGSGINILLKVWSRHTAAASEGLVVPSESRLSDADLDMSSALYPALEKSLSDFHPYNDEAAQAVSAEQAQAQTKLMGLATEGNCAALAEINPQLHWYLSTAKLEELRKLGEPPSADLPSVTDNAAVMALAWMHLTRAREMAHPGSFTVSSMVTGINVRKRMDPPLPDEYPMNAIVVARATADVSELTAAVTTESLYLIASRIMESIRYWTPERLSALIGTIQACPKVENKMIPLLGSDLVTTSPTNLLDCLSNYEWGSELGRVKCLREAFPPFSDGLSLCLPSMRGGLELQLWAANDAMDQLKADKDWASWMELVV